MQQLKFIESDFAQILEVREDKTTKVIILDLEDLHVRYHEFEKEKEAARFVVELTTNTANEFFELWDLAKEKPQYVLGFLEEMKKLVQEECKSLICGMPIVY